VRKRVTILFIIWIAGLKLTGQDIKLLLPALQELPGWQFSAEPQVYDGDKLFELINGGADIYLEYGFSRVVSVHYLDPSQNDVQLEIYEMSDNSAAYGIFSITQQTASWSKGNGIISANNDDYFSFWKSRYYVNISWSSGKMVDKALMVGFADLVSGKIEEEGNIPDLVRAYKQSDPLEKNIYFRGRLGLSNFYYFDYKDIFRIQEGLAWLKDGYRQVIFRYADQAAATDVVSNARQSMANNKRFTDLADTFNGFSCKDNKGNFILIRQIENYIAVLVALDQTISLVPFMDDITLKIENNNK